MMPKPQIRSLNYIRTKDAMHAEALDDLIQAMSNLPSYVDLVTPTGAVDGKNRIFYLAQAPNPPKSLHFYVNGVLQTGLSVKANVVTLANSPAAKATVQASYRY